MSRLAVCMHEPRAVYRPIQRSAMSFAEALARWGVQLTAGGGVLLLDGPETTLSELERLDSSVGQTFLAHLEDLYRLGRLCERQPTDLPS